MPCLGLRLSRGLRRFSSEGCGRAMTGSPDSTAMWADGPHAHHMPWSGTEEGGRIEAAPCRRDALKRIAHHVDPGLQIRNTQAQRLVP